MLIVIRPGLFAILASAPVFLGLLLQPLHLGDIFPLEFSKSHPSPPRILLLTAHPDDETFFFGPTVTSLIPSYAVPVSASPRANTLDSVTPTFPQVYSLCLSVGNADGLGDIRRRELEESLDVLGVAEDKRWVLDKLYVSWSSPVTSNTGSLTKVKRISGRHEHEVGCWSHR
jgi:N-acetylglucosaminylphosphatidylinositol deacetylase